MMFMRFPIDAVFVTKPDTTASGASDPCTVRCARGPASCR